jgi:hypothetical protein
VEEAMVIEEFVEQSREEKRRLFGELGIHYDCVNYGTFNGKPFCNACVYYEDKRRIKREQTILQCEMKMCYFYEPKRKDDLND